MKRGFFKVLAVLLCCGAALAAPSKLELREGLVSVAYPPGNEDAARRALAEIQAGLREFGDRLPPGDKPVYVLIAENAAEFNRHASSFLPGQVSALARPAQGLIVLQPPKMRRHGYEYGGTIRHELVHILLDRNTNPAYLPNWLNEGLAMFLAREYQFATPITIASMMFEGRIIPYQRLDMAFLTPGEEMQFGDAYAQALSMTRYLHQRAGADAFWRIVLATREKHFADALREHAGADVFEFWDGYMRSLWLVAVVGALASGSFFTPAAVIVIIAFFRVRSRNRRTLDQWAEQEAADDAAPPLMTWEEAINREDTYIPGIDDEDEEY